MCKEARDGTPCVQARAYCQALSTQASIVPPCKNKKEYPLMLLLYSHRPLKLRGGCIIPMPFQRILHTFSACVLQHPSCTSLFFISLCHFKWESLSNICENIMITFSPVVFSRHKLPRTRDICWVGNWGRAGLERTVH